MNEQRRSSIRQLLLVGTVLLVGGAVTGALVLTRGTPPRAERQVLAPVVQVVMAEPQNVPVKIRGNGSVQSTVKAQVVPQVGGRIVSVHEHMFSGGFVPAGEPLLGIDRSDYQLALDEAESQLQQFQASVVTGETALEEARTNMRDATRELERIEQLHEKGVLSKRDADKAEIAWQVAQVRLQRQQAELQNAKSRLEIARVAVRRAELGLSRTRITFPFDLVILREQIDIGQYVLAGQSLAEVYGTSMVEIPVPLEDYHLKWLPNIPMAAKQARPGVSLPRAQVTTRFAGRLRRWEGRVVRTEGELDPKTRMVDVVVRVDDPMHGPSSDQPPLLPGTFVDVTIEGTPLENVVPLPRHALHEGDQFWIAEDGRLRVQKVEIARQERDTVYVSSGLEKGQQIIVSNMDVMTDGMEVRVALE